MKLDTWTLLNKELAHFDIHLINDKKCRIYSDDILKTQGVIQTVRQIRQSVNDQKKVLLSLWKETVELLIPSSEDGIIIDEKMVNLFVFSLKDLSKFLLCFDDLEGSVFQNAISNALNRDIKSFSKEQIYALSDYKICVEWVHRLITRLLYLSDLLAFASIGKKRVSEYDIKEAYGDVGGGISGPWAHLDLPITERMYPYEREYLRHREKDKQKQRRYRKGLENYNNDGRVGEGHMWRELRNEPYSWADRGFEDPYPSRHMLSR